MCDHWHKILTDKWRCADCGEEVKVKYKSLTGYKSDNKRRIPMTEWEKMKLSFYRDERKWHENIRNRTIVEKDGVKTVVLTDGKGNIKRELPKP